MPFKTSLPHTVRLTADEIRAASTGEDLDARPAWEALELVLAGLGIAEAVDLLAVESEIVSAMLERGGTAFLRWKDGRLLLALEKSTIILHTAA